MGEHDDPGGSVSAHPDAPATRTRAVLIALVVVYGVSLLALAALDQVGVVWKSLIVPGLAVAAALTGRFRAFVRDWAVFLAAVVLFDASRGLAFGLITHFELPVYMDYAIRAERALFGEPLLTLRVQALLAPGGEVDGFDRFLAVVYGSHFLAFLLYGLFVWMLREREFGRFKLAMLSMMYAGGLCYLLVPTVPPWMAAHVYHVIPPILEIGSQLFHGSLPKLTAAFEINPVAAMPSLHCAFPTLLTLVTFKLFGRRFGLAMAAYTFCVYLSTIHLGHHYAVDVLGGIALAVPCYLAAYHGDGVARAFGALTPARATASALRLRILVTALLLMLTEASGILAPLLTGGSSNPLPSEEFIARELVGKSPMVSYYRGMRAFEAGQHADAKRLLLRAAGEVPTAKTRESAIGTLVLSAYNDHDYTTVLAVAGELHGMPPGVALIVAEALVRTGQPKKGFQLLDSVVRDHPDDPEVKAIESRLAPYRSGG